MKQKTPHWGLWVALVAGLIPFGVLAAGDAASGDEGVAGISLPQVAGNGPATLTSRLARFDEVCTTVESAFWDPEAVAKLFRPAIPSFRARVASATTEEEFGTLVNELLAVLKTSHTSYFTPVDLEYFLYAGVFQGVPAVKKVFPEGRIRFPSLGIFTRVIDGKRFVTGILEGGPGETGGLKTGNEILSLDGAPFTPITALTGREDRPVRLVIRRQADGAEQAVTATPRSVEPKEELLAAVKASRKVIPHGGRKIAYIRMWSYAGQEFQDAFLDAVATDDVQAADALIWDLRDGLGGASPEYLNVFNPVVPAMQFRGRDGKGQISDSQWRKPVVMLINGGTRSGKEILAFGMKKHRIGTLIGERTAGAVSAGKLHVLADGAFLYVAVMAGTVDGVKLEGNGVVPDIEVPMPIPYRGGTDPQLEAALNHLSKAAR